jgi:type VI secretion system secreted protein VgrG
VSLNRVWLISEVSHRGDQPGVLEHESPSDRGMRYNAAFSAIPSETRFVPECKHKKVKVDGVQCAIVTGPVGEEIYPDQYGRVKVQFFWDRLGQADANTTCWIRVSQGWAGSQFGMMAIPRIGQEVLVSFLEGDPDRPLITGRVYNELLMPPYALPEHKTRTVFKSMSTPGKEDERRGFNELRIEDEKGEEEIYLHGEKDVNVFVKNDWKEHIGHDFHTKIDNSSYLETMGETHEILHSKRKIEIQANDNRTIQGDMLEKIDNKWLIEVGDEYHLKSGMKIILDAGTEFTIKSGDSFIKLDPGGVKIVGPAVDINSGGSPGNGTPSAPELPDETKGAEAGTKVKRTDVPLHPHAGEDQEKTIRGASGLPFVEICEQTPDEALDEISSN